MTGVLQRSRIAWQVRRGLRRELRTDDALRELRGFARRSSPHLGRLHGDSEDAPLAELPVLTKAELLDHFDELVTDPGLRRADLERHVATAPPGSPYGRYRVGVSSGSSGRTVVLAFDPGEWVAKIVNAARAREVNGIRGPAARSAKVSSPSQWHLSSQVGATLSDPRRPSLHLPATTPMDQLVAELNRWRPSVLNGYASVLGALAGAQLDGELAIAPTAVLSGAELLSDEVRSRIRSAWDVEAHDQYVTTEAGFVASECEHHDGMHLIGDAVVEVVDAENRPVPDGTAGAAVLVSVLSSRTLPLIRYRIDDSVVVDPRPCPCGRPTPRVRVLGRGRELLKIPHGGARYTVHPVVFSQVLDAHRLAGWQVVHRDGHIQLLLAGADDPAAIARAVGEALHGATGVRIPVTATEVPEIHRGPSGKAAMVVDEDAATN